MFVGVCVLMCVVVYVDVVFVLLLWCDWFAVVVVVVVVVLMCMLLCCVCV